MYFGLEVARLLKGKVMMIVTTYVKNYSKPSPHQGQQPTGASVACVAPHLGYCIHFVKMLQLDEQALHATMLVQPIINKHCGTKGCSAANMMKIMECLSSFFTYSLFYKPLPTFVLAKETMRVQLPANL